MCSKLSVAFVFTLFEFIPINATSLFWYFSAVFRVVSSDPTTKGQWLHVKNITSVFDLKSVSLYVFPLVAGSSKSGAFAPSCNVNDIDFLVSWEYDAIYTLLHQENSMFELGGSKDKIIDSVAFWAGFFGVGILLITLILRAR